MKRQLTNSRARETLDRRFAAVDLGALSPRPHRGWIRAIRDALGMTTRQMANRMGVAQPTVSSMERAEMHGVIQLDTLHRAADALDCDVVYALVPRGSLRDIVIRQAQAQARWRIAPVDHTMRLEAQGLDDDTLRDQLDRVASLLIDTPRLWDGPIE